MKSILVSLLILITWAQESKAPTPRPTKIPVDYSADRFIVQPVTTDGNVLRLIADTGGGLFIFDSAVKRLGLSPREVSGKGEKSTEVKLPQFKPEASIPSPEFNDGWMPVFPEQGPSLDNENLSGMVGQAWFAGHVWTFDYPGHSLWLWPNNKSPERKNGHELSLGFPTDSSGQRGANFPRIQATINGQTEELLFDTGATTNLSPRLLQALNDHGPKTRATSFITHSTLTRWHQAHPEWKMIRDESAKLDKVMIQVPNITVAGYTVGPVWFTERPDKNFHEWMSQWMDKEIDGALGGDALKFFKITLDYPNAKASFEKQP